MWYWVSHVTWSDLFLLSVTGMSWSWCLPWWIIDSEVKGLCGNNVISCLLRIAISFSSKDVPVCFVFSTKLCWTLKIYFLLWELPAALRGLCKGDKKLRLVQIHEVLMTAQGHLTDTTFVGFNNRGLTASLLVSSVNPNSSIRSVLDLLCASKILDPRLVI